MKRILTLFGTAALFAAALSYGADQTWTAAISDSKCGASHQAAVEHAGKVVSDRDCTLACLKGGAKYVVVHDGKVYNVDNQDFAALARYAGTTAKVTGEVSGDSIKISKIEKSS